MERCSSCGSENAAGARFCNQCGAPFPAPRSAPQDDAERKQVTVLFSDLSGYTALSERLDPEDTREIMAAIFQRAAELVARYGGRIEKFIGDAMMAIFGVPRAHEDDPIRAVRAALELHRAVAEMAPAVEARSGIRISLHSGINTGLVVTGELRFDHGTAGPLGDTINLAARLMALAGPDEIWLGPEARKLVAGAFAVEDLGVREVKGKAEPVVAARVLSAIREEAPLPSHRRGTFVGRQEELGILLGAVERLRDGEGGAIAIVGEAGSGKTRLVEELRARLGPDVQWLEGRAYDYAENIPYYPVIDLLSRSWGIEEGDSALSVRAKVEAEVGALVEEPDALPTLGLLYDLAMPGADAIDRATFPGRILEVVRRLLASLAARAPTVICLQDLHWADAATMSLLRGLIRGLAAPALFVCNHRPGFELGEEIRRLELRELSARQTRELVVSLLEGALPPEPLVRFVEERCDGNPFYVEEVVHSLLETHAIVRSDAVWTLTRPLAEAGVPTTVRGVVAARIDRLDERRRRILREAAVVGREFLYRLIAQVSLERSELQPSLQALEAVDLIRTKSRDPELEYSFRHALTQEVAYDGLLRSERQKIHERVAYAMEALLGERASELVEMLAYHFLRGCVVDKAVHYATEAGRKCVARFALDEATAHFQNGMGLLAERERTQAEDRALVALLVEWNQLQFYLGRFAELRALLEAHEDVAARCGDGELYALFVGWLGYVRFHQRELHGSLETLERACDLAAACNGKRATAYAHAWKAIVLHAMGRTTEALRAAHLAHALAPLFPEAGNYLYTESLLNLGMATANTGDLEQARRIGMELIAFAERTGNSRASILGNLCLVYCHLAASEPQAAIEAAESAADRAQEPHLRNLVLSFLSLGYASAQDFARARAVAERVLADAVPYGAESIAVPARVAAALAALGEGRLTKGMATLLELREEAARRGALYDRTWIGLTIAIVHARIARREVPVAVRSLLRNPGFVLRHALPARRKARARLEQSVQECERGEIRSHEGTAHLELAALLARSDPSAARKHLERAIAIFERQGAEGALGRARELAASLGDPTE